MEKKKVLVELQKSKGEFFNNSYVNNLGLPEISEHLEALEERKLFANEYSSKLEDEECDIANQWRENIHERNRDNYWEDMDPIFYESRVYSLIYSLCYYHPRNIPDEFRGNDFIGELFPANQEGIKDEVVDNNDDVEMMEELYFRLNLWKTTGYTS